MTPSIITLGPVWSRVTVAPPEALAAVRAALTVRKKGAEYIQRKYGYSGEIKFFVHPNRFPTGLLSRVLGVLQVPGATVRLEGTDAVTPPPHNPLRFALIGMELRPYQTKACDDALKLRRCAIKAPTGSGKTEIAAELIRRTGLPTLYLVHRKELLAQTVERLHARLGVRPYALGAATATGNRDNATASGNIIVAMVQTLSLHTPVQSWWAKWGVLFCDEVHHLGSDSWYRLAMVCPAPYRFGLSGTPITGDPVRDMRLEAATGPLLVAAENEELSAAKFLARPRVVMLDVGARHYPTVDDVRTAIVPMWKRNPRLLESKGGALYREAYERGVTKNYIRNDALRAVAVNHAAAGDKVLVLVSRVEHGKRITDEMEASQRCPVWWLSGKENDGYRKHALEVFREAHDGAVLVASPIFDEGVDIPEVDVLILAGAGGKGHADDVPATVTLQRVGRALRPRPDKSEVLVYDVWDGNGDHPKDYLRQHAAKRKADYEAQGWAVEVRRA